MHGHSNHTYTHIHTQIQIRDAYKKLRLNAKQNISLKAHISLWFWKLAAAMLALRAASESPQRPKSLYAHTCTTTAA